jgi:hypothetical protein
MPETNFARRVSGRPFELNITFYIRNDMIHICQDKQNRCSWSITLHHRKRNGAV